MIKKIVTSKNMYSCVASKLRNSFKIRTCINKIYNNYSHIIIFNFKNNKKPHTKNVTRKTTILVLKTLKTDSAQSSSNKCKNYLLKIFSQHINFLNTI